MKKIAALVMMVLILTSMAVSCTDIIVTTTHETDITTTEHITTTENIIAIPPVNVDNTLNPDIDIFISPYDVKYTDLITKTYSKEELSTIKYNTSLNIKDFNELYKMECVRIVEVYNEDLNTTEYYYRVVYSSGERLCMVYFNYAGEFVTSRIHIKGIARLTDFQNLSNKKWTDSEDVHSIDEDGFYPFLTGASVPEYRFSTHVTEDGYFVYIKYREKGRYYLLNEMEIYII